MAGPRRIATIAPRTGCRQTGSRVGWHPGPRPPTTGPPARTASVVRVLATTAGWRTTGSVMLVASAISPADPATLASAVVPSQPGMAPHEMVVGGHRRVPEPRGPRRRSRAGLPQLGTPLPRSANGRCAPSLMTLPRAAEASTDPCCSPPGGGTGGRANDGRSPMRWRTPIVRKSVLGIWIRLPSRDLEKS